jgi:hypothetical protein
MPPHFPLLKSPYRLLANLEFAHPISEHIYNFLARLEKSIQRHWNAHLVYNMAQVCTFDMM